MHDSNKNNEKNCVVAKRSIYRMSGKIPIGVFFVFLSLSANFSAVMITPCQFSFFAFVMTCIFFTADADTPDGGDVQKDPGGVERKC